MKTKYKLITPVAVKTRVNECENKIWVSVCTEKPLTDRETKKKVKKYLMSEYAVEGAYDVDFNSPLTLNSRIVYENNIDRYLAANPKVVSL